MSGNFAYSNEEAVASALRWWSDSGVDVLTNETPMPWLGETAPQPVAAIAPAPEPSLPDSLDKLIAWMASANDFHESGPANQRLSPTGRAGAELMIITDMPEPGDVSNRTLMSGEVGQLFDNMLRAIKLDRSGVYFVALSPGRPASGRLDEARLPWLGEIARHHIRLAGPKKVWLLGQSTSRAVAGVDATAGPSQLLNINHEGGTVAAIASVHPRLLVQHPKLKAKVWADMQLLLGE